MRSAHAALIAGALLALTGCATTITGSPTRTAPVDFTPGQSTTLTVPVSADGTLDALNLQMQVHDILTASLSEPAPLRCTSAPATPWSTGSCSTEIGTGQSSASFAYITSEPAGTVVVTAPLTFQ